MWNNFKSDIKYKLNKQRVEHPVAHVFMKWILIILLIILIILLLIFILVFVVFPIVFMLSIGLQRALIFFNFNVPKDPKFEDPSRYGFNGVTNFYITTPTDMDNMDIISIGAWWVPQENYINSTETMDDILAKNEYPVVLYNHGVMATRILTVDYVYSTLRKLFHVIAIDYRDFGDSTSKGLSEDGVVADVVHTYNLVKKKTNQDVFVWGHSLGGGISTHAVKWLKDNQNETPAGLVIESSFTSLQEEIYEFNLAKLFRWLPWFDLCIVNPVHNNGFIFNTTRNVQDVDCPIMIMHAGDDPTIPFFLGEKNYKQTNASRKPNQGKVFFHPFAAEKHYGHVGCTQDPAVPGYIKEFIQECKRWKRLHSWTE